MPDDFPPYVHISSPKSKLMTNRELLWGSALDLDRGPQIAGSIEEAGRTVKPSFVE